MTFGPVPRLRHLRTDYGRQLFAGTDNSGTISFQNTDDSPLYSGASGNGQGWSSSFTMNSLVTSPPVPSLPLEDAFQARTSRT